MYHKKGGGIIYTTILVCDKALSSIWTKHPAVLESPCIFIYIYDKKTKKSVTIDEFFQERQVVRILKQEFNEDAIQAAADQFLLKKYDVLFCVQGNYLDLKNWMEKQGIAYGILRQNDIQWQFLSKNQEFFDDNKNHYVPAVEQDDFQAVDITDFSQVQESVRIPAKKRRRKNNVKKTVFKKTKELISQKKKQDLKQQTEEKNEVQEQIEEELKQDKVLCQENGHDSILLQSSNQTAVSPKKEDCIIVDKQEEKDAREYKNTVSVQEEKSVSMMEVNETDFSDFPETLNESNSNSDEDTADMKEKRLNRLRLFLQSILFHKKKGPPEPQENSQSEQEERKKQSEIKQKMDSHLQNLINDAEEKLNISQDDYFSCLWQYFKSFVWLHFDFAGERIPFINGNPAPPDNDVFFIVWLAVLKAEDTTMFELDSSTSFGQQEGSVQSIPANLDAFYRAKSIAGFLRKKSQIIQYPLKNSFSKLPPKRWQLELPIKGNEKLLSEQRGFVANKMRDYAVQAESVYLYWSEVYIFLKIAQASGMQFIKDFYKEKKRFPRLDDYQYVLDETAPFNYLRHRMLCVYKNIVNSKSLDDFNISLLSSAQITMNLDHGAYEEIKTACMKIFHIQAPLISDIIKDI